MDSVKNGSVTLYHYDENTEVYLQAYFESVSVFLDNKVITNDRGLTADDVLKIRIYTDEAIAIDKDDRLVLGRAETAIPPKTGTYKVIGFSDNRRGSKKMWHWRVLAK